MIKQEGKLFLYFALIALIPFGIKMNGMVQLFRHHRVSILINLSSLKPKCSSKNVLFPTILALAMKTVNIPTIGGIAGTAIFAIVECGVKTIGILTVSLIVRTYFRVFFLSNVSGVWTLLTQRSAINVFMASISRIAVSYRFVMTVVIVMIASFALILEINSIVLVINSFHETNMNYKKNNSLLAQ